MKDFCYAFLMFLFLLVFWVFMSSDGIGKLMGG